MSTPSPTPVAQSAAVPQALAGRYIVVFKPTVGDPQIAAEALVHGIPGAQLHQVYTHALKGFSASLPAAALNGLRHHPDVQGIEPDQPVQAFPAPARP